jgi:protein-S-isoprenylcysteine O-methyltransferase Ste14
MSAVSNGIYGLSRHPIYLGLALRLASNVWVSYSLAFVIVIASVVYIDRLQILPEESVFLTKFGTEYATYQQQVRRWL